MIKLIEAYAQLQRSRFLRTPRALKSARARFTCVRNDKFLSVFIFLILFWVTAGAQTTSITGTIKDITGQPVTTGKISFQLMPGADATISGQARYSLTTTNCKINQPQISTVSRSSNVVTATLTAVPAIPFVVGDVVGVTGVTDNTYNVAQSAGVTIASVSGGGQTLTWNQTAANSSSSGGTVGGIMGPLGTGVCTITTTTSLMPPGYWYLVKVWPLNVATSQFTMYAVSSSYDLSTIVPTPTTTPIQNFVDTFSSQTIAGNKTFSGNTIFNGSVTYNGSLALTGALSVTGNFSGSTEGLTGSQLVTFGSHNTTTTETIINAGNFPYSAPFPQSDYLAVDINGLDFQAEQLVSHANGTLDAVAGGIHVPTSQTAVSGGFAMQQDAVAGYVFDEGPNADPVGIYGQARVNFNNTGQNQAWAANFWCGDTAGMTQSGSCYGLEIDVNQVTNNLGGWAQDFNGNWTGGGNTYGGLLFVQPVGGATKHWKPGIEFGVGATGLQDTSGNAAILFLPLASGNSQSSQGLLFESTSSGGVTQYFAVGEDQNGRFSLSVPGVANRLWLEQDGQLEYRRLEPLLGSNASCSDVSAISAGWGTGASCTSVRGQDGRVEIKITAGSSPSANPNISYTYHNGGWDGGNVPLLVVSRCDSASPQTAIWVTGGTSSNTLANVSFIGTPVNGSVYCAVVDSQGSVD